MEEGQKQKKIRGGSFCIVPGCSNEYYRTKARNIPVFYHCLPLNKPQLLGRWLAALKRRDPPVGRGRRVCSDHFKHSDYLEKGSFDECGKFFRSTTNRLKPDAVPSVFTVSSHKVGNINRPILKLRDAALRRKERVYKRARQTEERQVAVNTSCQTTRRLELEAAVSQDRQDGGGTETKKHVASQTTIGGKRRRSLLDGSRCDTSLGILTQRFRELLSRSVDGVLDLNVVSQELNTPKRRVYDVTNVLEGIKLIKKESKNHIQWLGGVKNEQVNGELKALIEEERKLDGLILSSTQQISRMCEDRRCQRYAYLTYEDVSQIPSLKEQTVIVIKAPAETKLQVPHPAEKLQVHLSSVQGPIEVFLCQDKPASVEPINSTSAKSDKNRHVISSDCGNDFFLPLPFFSFMQASSKGDTNSSCGVDGFSNQQSKLTQRSSQFSFTPTPNSVQPPPEDQHNHVIPPLAFSLSGEEYLLNLAEDEGISDLFPMDLDQSLMDIPLL